MSIRKRTLTVASAVLISAASATAPAATAQDSSLSTTDDMYGVPGSEQFMPLLELPIIGPILYYAVGLPIGIFIIGMHNLQNRIAEGSS